MIPDETQIPSMTFKIFASQRLRKNVGRVVHTRHFDEFDDTFFKTLKESAMYPIIVSLRYSSSTSEDINHACVE